jgi:pilus assembly protein Flp/PilA
MLEPMMKWWVALQMAAQAALGGAKSEGGAGEGEEGQTLVEYALILVLIAIVVIVVLTLVGTRVNNIFNTVANVLQIN